MPKPKIKKNPLVPGQQVGNWTVIENAPKRSYWRASCICGKIVEKMRTELERVDSCGCQRLGVGDKVGNWIVIGTSEKQGYWTAQCICGKICERTKSGMDNAKSCGCLQKSPRVFMQVGDMYGYWKVLKLLPNAKALCLCTKCSETKRPVLRDTIKQGKSQSCGCQLKVGDKIGNWTTIAPSDKGNGYWQVQCFCGEMREKTKSGMQRAKSCGCLKIKTKIGDIIGNWEIIAKGPKSGHWRVRCVCGTEIVKAKDSLQSHNQSCGCQGNYLKVGDTIGNWTVIGETSRRGIWLLQCVCGEIREKGRTSLKNEKSCGCLKLFHMKQSMLENYGVENPLHSDIIREKIKQTNLRRHGVENPSQLTEVREKATKTNLKRFGVKHAAQAEKVQEKTKQTNLEKYGTEHVLQVSEIRQKGKETCLAKYGTDNPLKSPIIQQKIREVNLERYGVEYPAQSPEIALKGAKKKNNTYIEYHWNTNEELVCTGSYEAKVVNYLNKHKIDYLWQPKSFYLKNIKRTYRPDLYLVHQRLWIEIKGYEYEMGMQKFAEFAEEHSAELWNEAKLKEMNIL